MNENNMRIITAAVKEIRELTDKYGKDYLFLKLENGEGVFVFPKRIEPDRWVELAEGLTYSFTLEKNNTGNLVVNDFDLVI